MTYHYLTASYVDWLRLPEVPFTPEMSIGPIAVARKLTHGRSYTDAYPSGVVLDGLRYKRSRDGKSFDLIEADRWALTHAAPVSVADAFSGDRRLHVA